MSVFKGSMHSTTYDIECECAGSIYLRVLSEEGPNASSFPVLGYRGTVVIRDCRFRVGEDVRLTTDNGFDGKVRLDRVEVADEGRSFLARIASVGRPNAEPVRES